MYGRNVAGYGAQNLRCSTQALEALTADQCGWYKARARDRYRTAEQPYRWLACEPGRYYFVAHGEILSVKLLPCSDPRVAEWVAQRHVRWSAASGQWKQDPEPQRWTNVACEQPTIMGSATTADVPPIKWQNYDEATMTPMVIASTHHWMAQGKSE